MRQDYANDNMALLVGARDKQLDIETGLGKGGRALGGTFRVWRSSSMGGAR
jgi:hypothetical protein